jgi:hypothetical protein
MAAATLEGDIVKSVDSKDKIAYPKFDSTLPIVYYLDTFQGVAEANGLPEINKATACASPPSGAALMIAREFFESTKGTPTFAALRGELIAKLDFKSTRADKIRFGRLKLKPGQEIKAFVQELRLAANQSYAAEEGFTLQAIEVRIYEQFLAGLTGELKDVTAATSPLDLDHAMTAALNAVSRGVSRDEHVVHPVTGASTRPRPNTVHPPRSQKGRGQTRDGNRRGGASNSVSQTKCPYCKRNGHNENRCWEKDPTKAPERIQRKLRDARCASSKNGERGGNQDPPSNR